MRARLALVLALIWIGAFGVAPARAGVFSDWAVIVVAGDQKAHSGAPSEVFDNARHDLSEAFVRAGFSAANLRQFSVSPERYHDPALLKSNPETIAQTLGQLAKQAPKGCLLYFTSHGSPDGIVVGDELWPPGEMGRVVDDACGQKPAVVVVAACFSGVFMPDLQGPNRMVLTAARPDRASFGCGEADHYTFFDTCFLQTLPQVHNFFALGPAVQACVAQMEKDENATPPSEPQLDIGAVLRPMLPLYAFQTPP